MPPMPSNQVWGLATTDPEWLAALEAALTTTRRAMSSTARMRRMCMAVFAATVGSISRSGRPVTVEYRFWVIGFSADLVAYSYRFLLISA
jgi:hypothetical protein